MVTRTKRIITRTIKITSVDTDPPSDDCEAAAVAATPVDLIDAADDALLTSGDDFGFSETTAYYE